MVSGGVVRNECVVVVLTVAGDGGVRRGGVLWQWGSWPLRRCRVVSCRGVVVVDGLPLRALAENGVQHPTEAPVTDGKVE